MKKIITITITLLDFIYGASPFNLDGIKDYDTRILSSAKELKPYYKDIIEMMNDTSKELNIKLKKSSASTLLLKIKPIALGKAEGYYLELNIAEFLKRKEIKKEAFSFTYQDVKIIKKEDVKESLEDNIQDMLDKYADEYRTDNNHKGRTDDIEHHNFAQKMGYLTDFKKALKDANSSKKYLMVVADADACPWCRKLEENILSIKDIDSAIKNKFVTAMVNVDIDSEPKFLKKKKSTPIIYIVDPRDKSIKAQFVGYPNSKNFIDSLVNESKKTKSK